MGEKDHSKAQRAILFYLWERRKRWKIFAIQEQRVQLSPTRYRIPDICVVVGPEPDEQIFTSLPFLCIEILSPEDRMSRMSRMQQKIDDCLMFGVRYVWVVDPQTRKAWIHISEGGREVRDGMLRTQDPELLVPLDAVFES